MGSTFWKTGLHEISLNSFWAFQPRSQAWETDLTTFPKTVELRTREREWGKPGPSSRRLGRRGGRKQSRRYGFVCASLAHYLEKYGLACSSPHPVSQEGREVFVCHSNRKWHSEHATWNLTKSKKGHGDSLVTNVSSARPRTHTVHSATFLMSDHGEA